MRDRLVIDASAWVDASVGNRRGEGVWNRIENHDLHAPAHIDAEILSAFGRLYRAGEITSEHILTSLEELQAAPVERHALAPLATGAWHRRHNFRTTDGLYVELALKLKVSLVTTDKRLAHATGVAELVGF